MKTKIIIAAIIVGLIAAFFIYAPSELLTLEGLKQQKDSLNQLYHDKPFLIGGLFFLIYVAVAALALPAATLLTVAAGAIFGLGAGVFIVSFASSIGATIAFLLTRYFFHDAIQAKFGDRLEAVNAGIEREGAFYVFGLRLVPLFPFVVVNSVLGLTKLKTVTFYWASQIGMLAGTAVYVNAGTQLADINSLSDIGSPKLIGSFVLLGLFPIIAKYALNFLKNRNKAEA